MTNQEAINTVEKFIVDLEVCDIPIWEEEREALEKLMSTAEEYDVLLTNIMRICNE